MAILTTKTELTTGPDVVEDVIHIVDVSDTTDDPTGTSKKIKVGQLLEGLPKQVFDISGDELYPGFIIIKKSGSTAPFGESEIGDIFIGKGNFFSNDFVIAERTSAGLPSVDTDFKLYFRAE